MVQEVLAEITHLGNLKESVIKESSSLDIVYKTIQDHNDYLRGQLESYKAYLQNVRVQSASQSKSKNSKMVGPFKFTHAALEKDGIIVESNVPENRRTNIYFKMMSPVPGTFIIALHYKGKS